MVNGEAKETAEDGTTKDIGAINFSDCEIVLANDIDLSAVCHPADESGAAEVNWTPSVTMQAMLLPVHLMVMVILLKACISTKQVSGAIMPFCIKGCLATVLA